jgi:hydrogenase-4 membrane subunit HyfE
MKTHSPDNALFFIILILGALFLVILSIVIFCGFSKSKNKDIPGLPEKSTTGKELLLLLGAPFIIYTIFSFITLFPLLEGRKSGSMGVAPVFFFMGIFFLVPLVSVLFNFFLKILKKNGYLSYVKRELTISYFFSWGLILFTFSFLIAGTLIFGV